MLERSCSAVSCCDSFFAAITDWQLLWWKLRSLFLPFEQSLPGLPVISQEFAPHHVDHDQIGRIRQSLNLMTNDVGGLGQFLLISCLPSVIPRFNILSPFT